MTIYIASPARTMPESSGAHEFPGLCGRHPQGFISTGAPRQGSIGA
jgi:hypothetical protein